MKARPVKARSQPVMKARPAKARSHYLHYHVNNLNTEKIPVQQLLQTSVALMLHLIIVINNYHLSDCSEQLVLYSRLCMKTKHNIYTKV